MSDISSAMERVLDALAHRDSKMADLAMLIVIEAGKFWKEESGDFCIQHISATSVVFGGRNRVVWTPTQGFMIDASYCGPEFIKHFWTIKGGKKFAAVAWTISDLGDMICSDFNAEVSDKDVEEFMAGWSSKVQDLSVERTWDVWKDFIAVDEEFQKKIAAARVADDDEADNET